jgi:sarcosine oxidase subunit gamma
MLESYSPLSSTPPINLSDQLTASQILGDASFSLRLHPASCEAASRCFGVDIPSRIGEVREHNGRRAVCVGPDEWILATAASESVEIMKASRSLEADHHHSLVEISDRECVIEVGGRSAGYALMAVCPLDLEAMASGTAVRTLFDRADVLIIKQAPERYRVAFLRSWSSHVWGLLAVIGQEIATGL